MNKPTVVLVAGGSCSGKSVFASLFKNSILLSLDSFYLPQKQIPIRDDGSLNFDSPQALDLAACAEAVSFLRRDGKATIPVYSYKANERTGTEVIELQADTKFIVVEGLFTLHSPLLELGDLKIFLDTPTEVRLARRMLRDVKRKGQSKLETLSIFPPIEVAYQQYVEPTKALADLIVPFSYSPLQFIN